MVDKLHLAWRPLCTARDWGALVELNSGKRDRETKANDASRAGDFVPAFLRAYGNARNRAGAHN
jgi:hypothetical protein